MRLKKRIDVAGVIVAGGIAIATPLIQRFEGYRSQAYPDLRGVWTACYGETQGVHPGDIFTREQCNSKLQQDLHTRSKQILSLIPDKSVLNQSRLAALLSFQYNNGQGTLASTRSPQACSAINKGRKLKHCHPQALVIYDLNRGDIQKACDDFLSYDWAAGREVEGLFNRRSQERDLCLKNNP